MIEEDEAKGEESATLANPFKDEKGSKTEAAAGAPGKSVLLFNNRQSLGVDNLASVHTQYPKHTQIAG